MAYSASPTILFRAKRETVLLVTSAAATTFALSYAVHAHRPAAHRIEAAAPRQPWMGELAEVAMLEPSALHATPITSASLVVPKSVLALPLPPVRPLVRLHGCDGALCTSRAAAPVPPRRQVVAVSAAAPVAPAAGQVAPPAVRSVVAPSREKPSLLARLNPLAHLPDGRTLKKPFAVASDTVTGWFKRF